MCIYVGNGMWQGLVQTPKFAKLAAVLAENAREAPATTYMLNTQTELIYIILYLGFSAMLRSLHSEAFVLPSQEPK